MLHWPCHAVLAALYIPLARVTHSQLLTMMQAQKFVHLALDAAKSRRSQRITLRSEAITVTNQSGFRAEPIISKDSVCTHYLHALHACL